jgi:hypothetical protein
LYFYSHFVGYNKKLAQSQLKTLLKTIAGGRKQFKIQRAKIHFRPKNTPQCPLK